ncbi:MAG: hypothetical protein V4591_09305 [Bdellovibrionota bacterium]
MADVRVNGKRIPPLQSIDDMAILIARLEYLADQNNKSALTALVLNGSNIDIDNMEYRRIKLETEDTIEAKFDTSEQLSFESLQVALDMADLLIFDLKLAAINIWDDDLNYVKTLETLLEDANLFLTLAAKPIYLLNKEPELLEVEAQNCLQELDRVANYIENATLLAVHGKNKDACYVLAGMVKSAIERWIGLSAIFAQSLNINFDSSASL